MSRAIGSLAGHLLAAALVAVAPFAVCAQEHVALVVGNGAYTHALKLPNPPNDAADMAAALRELGFEVISATDADKAAFDGALRDFARRLRGARTALFYYAGHGLQVAGKNYAVPIDARLEAAADLPVETVDIDQVLSVMQADENRVNLVFLDACRDNPLSRSFARSLPATRSASVGAGLSAVNAGRGTLIAYATAPNQVALDGARTRNSPFTAALLRHIGTPGLDIALIMRRVTADVEAASGGAQSPWVHASLTTDVVLKGGTAPAYSPPPGPAIASIDPSARVTPRPEIAAPNEPLPADIPISPDVLKVVETHPFFANAPAVSVASYVAENTFRTVMKSGDRLTSTAEESTDVRWLRRGIVKYEIKSESEFRDQGTNFSSSGRLIQVLAANGLIKLGHKHVLTIKGRTRTDKSTLLRISNMNGRIFPAAVGNRFSYELTHMDNSVLPDDEYTEKRSCEVQKRYEAKYFNAQLRGSAYMVSCEIDITYKKNKFGESSGVWVMVFFETLGLWVNADPIVSSERIASNQITSTHPQARSQNTYSYKFKSYLLAR